MNPQKRNQIPDADKAICNEPMRPYVLGIETSCDETAVAIVSADKQIIAHKVLSQIDDHAAFGGVVPEIAARSHISHLDHLIKNLLVEADMQIADLDAIAATTGPGLVGGLMVGVMTAKAIAKAADKPFIAVNHLAGHALTTRLTNDISFPYLLLLVSGGHCQILDVAGINQFTRLGTTIDDAAGEAFDKTAKLLGLKYPGGPNVERAALSGDATRFNLPRPLVGKPGCDFSFSGLKTAVRRAAEACVAKRGLLYDNDRNDLCASFQATMAACLCDRMKKAVHIFRINHQMPEDRLPFVVAGGVAANKHIRDALKTLMDNETMDFYAPPLALCTDNGAMIAWAALERFVKDPSIDDQDISPRPRWPLDHRAAPMIGSGRKGAKA